LSIFELTRLYLFIFGVLTIAGGVVGFVKAKSRASLVAGSISGVLLLLAGYLAGTIGRNGILLGLVVSFALATRFVTAFRTSRKIMPAGLMAALSVVGVALTVASLLR
jgi:uncharacterized membrane protein (UPF0136 family)